MTISKYERLPSVIHHCIYEFVTDQLQIKSVSKKFLNGFDIFKILKKQYQSAQFPLLASLTKKMVTTSKPNNKVIVTRIYKIVIQNTKDTREDIVPDVINSMKGNSHSSISPYTLEKITEKTMQEAEDCIKLFRRSSLQIVGAYWFLESVDESNPIEAARTIRTWMGQRRENYAEVTELDLSYLKLTSLPKEISFFTHLKSLDIHVNHLVQLELPRTLTALMGLNVGSNLLEQIVIPEIPRTLIELDISCNRLTAVPQFLAGHWKEGQGRVRVLDTIYIVKENPFCSAEKSKVDESKKD